MPPKEREIIRNLVKEIRHNSQNLAKLKKILKEAKKNGIDLNIKYYKGRTLMHYASITPSRGVINLLSKLGVDVRICDDDYNTPLHLAIIKNKYICVKELLKIKNIDINAPGEFEQTPLHLAVVSGNFDIIKLLVRYGADITLVDEKNFSPIDYAKDEKDDKIINYLSSIINKRKEV